MSSLSLLGFFVRLAGGLSFGLVMLGWRGIPPNFRRVCWLVILGVLAVSLLIAINDGGIEAFDVVLGVELAVAFAASVLWGLGAETKGMTAEILGAVLGATLLAWLPQSESQGLEGLGLVARFSSSVYLGVTTLSMLLGHHYLTAPMMSLAPLKRLLRIAAAALILRAGLAVVGASTIILEPRSGGSDATFWAMILLMRWGLGLIVPAVGIGMAWGSVKAGSTQSATGILYVMVAFTIVGELSATYLGNRFGAAF